jgi:L-fuconate dehydratase
MRVITHWATRDVRFPTSKELDGSDAMNPDPDYSAACVSFGAEDGPRGHSSVFTIGRGNDVQVAALEALRPYVLGRDLDELLADMSALYLELTGDSQLRWLGPEKGVMHMAIGAVVNALWDVKAKEAHKPLWELLSDMNPEELAGLIDYRYISTALDRDRVTDMFRSQHASRAERKDRLRNEGYPAYTTSPGWLGYSDDKLVRLAREAMEEGFTRIKLKVGANKDDDVRRLTLARET